MAVMPSVMCSGVYPGCERLTNNASRLATEHADRCSCPQKVSDRLRESFKDCRVRNLIHREVQGEKLYSETIAG